MIKSQGRKVFEVVASTVGLILTTCFGITIYEIRKTKYILDNSFDSKLLERLDLESKRSSSSSSYIYINDEQYSMSSFSSIWNLMTILYCNRLLGMTKSSDRTHRLKAVRDLAKVKTLQDWNFKVLAENCDSRTAIGLARNKTVDLRLFLDPPNGIKNPNLENIMKTIKNFIIMLDNHSKHPCLTYCISKMFHDKSQIVDNDSTSVEIAKKMQNENDVLPYCLKTILHHVTIGDNARDIVKLQGLPLLMEIQQKFQNNDEIIMILARIMAAISNYPEYTEELFHSGWIGVLAKWIQHPDIRISIPAAHALVNLDSDDKVNVKYARNIYLLHPIYRAAQRPEIDVVLVHGLLGGVFFTWRQRDKEQDTLGLLGKTADSDESITSACEEYNIPKKISDHHTSDFLKDVEEHIQKEWDKIGKEFEIVLDDIPVSAMRENGENYLNSICTRDICSDLNNYSQCWPRDWLPKDCGGLRIIGVNYETNLSLWAPMCPEEKVKSNLNERSEEIMNKLIKSGIGTRPILWITHSMGGLLVKNMLVKAWESNNEKMRNMYRNSKGIVFYSTPHQGSKLATLKQATALLLWPSVEVRELRENSPDLLKLHDKFLQLLNQHKMNIISFVETKSTLISPMKFNMQFVDKISADPGIGEFYEISQDHLSICKPPSRQSFLYQKVIKLINELKSMKDETL